MTFLSFLASVIGSTAWPAFGLAVVLIFKTEVKRLLPGIRGRWKRGEDVVEFWLAKADEAAQGLPDPSIKGPPSPNEVRRLEARAASHPAALVVEAWLDVEAALAALATAAGLPTSALSGSAVLTSSLHQQGILDNATLLLIRELRTISNGVLHGSLTGISAEEAKRFRALADRCVDALMQAGQEMRGT